MSVIVERMDMPTACDKCRFCEYEEGRCTADEQERVGHYGTRPMWCPLKEIKPKHTCGECVHLCGKHTTVGIECMEPQLQWKWSGKYYRYRDTARYKYPSRKACRRFQPKS